jgi:class 3 adenylate cyclase/tetratricopeptide (TPR) repeat protein
VGDRNKEAVAFLPASLVRAVQAGEAGALPWWHEVEGTMVMADLSGFTALSERLGKLGDEGAERLTGTINSSFERMLDTASAYGGDTLTFGGDAILLLFDGEDHAGRAVAASLGMLKQTGRAAAIDAGDGKIKIGMSVGAHSDRFVLAGVGLADERAHLMVLGHGGEQTALAEAQADRGQLAVSAACKALLPAGTTSEPAGDFWLVGGLGARALPRPFAASPALMDEQLGPLKPFLPPYARNGRDDGGRLQLTPEHRRTVIVFVDVLGLTDLIDGSGLAATVEQLQTYAALLTSLATRHNGFVVSSDIATKGSKLIVTFGAPVAHEYAPTNAARFALDLNAGLRESGLDLHHKIGVNGGHVFAGEVGPAFRRQYTVMGDAVNLAARLMVAAELDTALASRNLLNYVSHTLCARELPPISVKGKEKPVAICVLEEEEPEGEHIHGAAAPRLSQGRLFGRRKELDMLARAWEQCRQGAGQTILVEGDAGVGKTRLLDEALRAMSERGRVTRTACFEHMQAAPFTPWVDFLRALLGIEPGDGRERRTAAVGAHLADRVPDQDEVGSLLNPLLDLALPQGDVVRSLDAQERRGRLFELVARIAEESARDQASAILVEDVHWMDESSLALAAHLAERLRSAPVLLLLTTRPLDVGDGLRSAAARRMVLAELTEPESLAMVREALGVADLPDAVGGEIYAKTRGNPLFLEEVVRSLQEPGVLDRILGATSVTRAAELAALEIPDRVQGLLMSRIDRLPSGSREVLKAGSVAGRAFDAALLAGIDDESLRGVSIGRALDELIGSSLVVLDEDGGPGAVSFRHALVQDVAYESLPFARRRDLHGRVGRYLEAASEVPDHGLLVHHYRRAAEDEKTRLHAVRAAESSTAAYANVEAVEYITLAIDTVGGRSPAHACLRSRLEELMGDGLQLASRHEEAIGCFMRARRRWTSPHVRAVAEDALAGLAPLDDPEARQSTLCWKVAVSAQRGLGAYHRALAWLDRATRALPAARSGLAARLLSTQSYCLSQLGRFREAIPAAEEAVALARESGDESLEAYSLSMLAIALNSQGRLERAIECDSAATSLYERAGDLAGQAISHANLAGDYLLIGDLRSALHHGELSLARSARIGDLAGVAVQNLNIGATLLQMGDLEQAASHLQQSVDLQDRYQLDPNVAGYAMVQLAKVAIMSGDPDAAEPTLVQGYALLHANDAQSLLLDACLVEADLRLALGDLDEAQASCERLALEARSVGADQTHAQALCALGRVLVARDDAEAAIEHLRAAVLLSEEVGAGYERAQALAALAEAETACAFRDDSCAAKLDEAISLFERMGAKYDLKKALATRQWLGFGASDGAGRRAVAAAERAT